MSARIAALPASSRDALAFAAAVGTPSSLAASARASPRMRSTPAVAARVIEREDGMIRFTHPLLASVLYADLGESGGASTRVSRPSSTSRPPRPPPRARDGRARCRRRASARRGRRAGGRSRRAGAGGRARGAGDQADAAGRVTSAAAGRSAPRVPISPPESGRARERSRRSSWPRPRAAPFRAEALLLVAEFEHDDLAVPVLEEALREAASDRRCGPASRSASPGRNASGRASRRRSRTRASRSRWRTASATSLRFEALVQLGWLGRMVGDAEAPAYAARARDLAAAAGDARLLREANVLVLGTLDDSGERRRADAPVLERE